MTKKMGLVSYVTFALGAVVGCGATPDARRASGAIVVSGSIGATSRPAPERAKAIVLWKVKGVSGESTFKQGDGTAGASGFRVELTAPLAAKSLRGASFAVGTIAIVDAAAAPADGPADDDLLHGAVATSRPQVLVYRTPGAAGPAWLAPFPEGYSCGTRGEDEQEHVGSTEVHHGGSSETPEEDGGVDDGRGHDGVEDGSRDGGVEVEVRDGGVEVEEAHDGGAGDGERHGDDDAYAPIDCSGLEVAGAATPAGTTPAPPAVR